jgi:hypothetical protein
MSRWFRFYEESLNDPKLLRLSDSLYRAWTILLCFASKNDGILPPVEDMAAALRTKPAKVSAWIKELSAGDLIDEIDGHYEPHNWRGRQFKSDDSNERVKRYRQRKCNVTSAVTVTPPDTEQIQKQNTDTESRGADAPPDKVVPMRRYAFEGRTIRLEQSDLNRWKETYRSIPDILAVLQSADDYYTQSPPKDGKWFFPVSNWLKRENDTWGEKIKQANARPDRSF